MTDRARCYDCHRPEAHCLCHLIEPIDHVTEILILQHPRERAHAFNTARLAERSLRHATMKVGYGSELAKDEALVRELEGCGLLYPRPGALDLSQVPADERPKKLVVLDGTWHHARAMYRDIPTLQGLTHYTLPAGQVSGFRIRKQPKDYCLSTVEAIQSALECLEPETPGLEALLRPFDAMQQQHIDSMGSPTPRRKKPKRVREGSQLPPQLKDEFESLVVVYGEMSPVTVQGERRQLLTFAAERPATGERMIHVLRNAGVTEEEWSFLRLDLRDIQTGSTLAELQAAWDAFRRPGDAMGAWSRSTLNVIGAHLQNCGPTVLLKAAYCNRHKERGCLEQLVVREGLIAAEELARREREMSRTEERLLNAVVMAQFLRQAPVTPR